MVEAATDINTSCVQFGQIEEEGKILLRDVFVPRDGKIYALTLATPEMLERIKKANEAYDDPEMKADENVFVIPDLSDFDALCNQLRLEVPFKALEPYLREQNLEEQTL